MYTIWYFFPDNVPSVFIGTFYRGDYTIVAGASDLVDFFLGTVVRFSSGWVSIFIQAVYYFVVAWVFTCTVLAAPGALYTYVRVASVVPVLSAMRWLFLIAVALVAVSLA